MIIYFCVLEMPQVDSIVWIRIAMFQQCLVFLKRNTIFYIEVLIDFKSSLKNDCYFVASISHNQNRAFDKMRWFRFWEFFKEDIICKILNYILIFKAVSTERF